MSTRFKHIMASLALALAVACPTAHAYADAPVQDSNTLTTPLVMIVVGFDGGDDPASATPYSDEYDWSTALFDENDSPAAYYRNMSNGLFNFTPARETSAAGEAGNSNQADRVNDGVIHVTLHKRHGAWGAVNIDASVTRDFANTVMEALQAASPFIDFSYFDADENSSLSERELEICLCIAGYEASSVTDYRRDDTPLLWSHSGMLHVLDNDARMIDDLQFESYITIAEQYWEEDTPLETAEQEPLGVLYHELGHTIGLPDLYAVTTTDGPWSNYRTGALSIMDSGGWQYVDDGFESRNIPTALDGWSRYILGWTEPTIVAHSGDYTVASQLSGNGYTSLIIPTSDPNQYFIVENRQPEGQDVGLSEEYDSPGGLVIWHVDQTMFDRYYDINHINDANHRPGVMELFFEVNGGSEYTTDWHTSAPLVDEAFFDATSWASRIGDATPLELPLYNELDDAPAARIASGITLSFPDASAQNMTVHIELDDTTAAQNALHLLDNEARNRFCMIDKSALSSLITLIKAPLR